MCLISFIGDHYTEKWTPLLPPSFDLTRNDFAVTRDEFEMLRREVENMKAMLIKAKIWDEEHGEADCGMDEKLIVLRRIAEFVGIDLDEVFGPK